MPVLFKASYVRFHLKKKDAERFLYSYISSSSKTSRTTNDKILAEDINVLSVNRRSDVIELGYKCVLEPVHHEFRRDHHQNRSHERVQGRGRWKFDQGHKGRR